MGVLEEEYAALKGGVRTVSPDDRLDDDLGIDSLLAQELLAALEDRLDVELIGEARLLEVKTAGQLVDLLDEIVGPRQRQ